MNGPEEANHIHFKCWFLLVGELLAGTQIFLPTSKSDFMSVKLVKKLGLEICILSWLSLHTLVLHLLDVVDLFFLTSALSLSFFFFFFLHICVSHTKSNFCKQHFLHVQFSNKQTNRKQQQASLQKFFSSLCFTLSSALLRAIRKPSWGFFSSTKAEEHIVKF